MDDAVLPYFMEYMEKQNAMNLLNFWLTVETFRLSTISRLKTNSVSRLKAANHPNGRITSGKDNETMATDNSSCVLSDVDSALGDSGIGEIFSSPSSTESAEVIQRNDNDDFGSFASYDPSVSEITSLIGQVNVSENPQKCSVIRNSSSSCNHGKGDDRKSIAELSNHSNINETSKSSDIEPLTLSQREFMNRQQVSSGRSLDMMTDSCQIQSLDSSKSRGLRVKFDLTPDYEDRQREFCRRRTRSIVIDALSIYTKYISLDSTHPFGLEESLRRQIEGKL